MCYTKAIQLQFVYGMVDKYHFSYMYRTVFIVPAGICGDDFILFKKHFRFPQVDFRVVGED